jgi:hypothetical protein
MYANAKAKAPGAEGAAAGGPGAAPPTGEEAGKSDEGPVIDADFTMKDDKK